MNQNDTTQIANEYLSKILKMSSNEINDNWFNETEWYMLCLTGKEIDDKPMLKVLQAISDEYAKQCQRDTYPVIINTKGDVTLAAADGSKGIIEVYDDKIQDTPFTKRFVLSNLHLKHENRHFDDWTKLKFCKPPKSLKKEHSKIMRNNRKKLAKVKKPQKNSPLLETREKEMQTLIVARMIDDKMWDYVKKYKLSDPNIAKVASDYYAYLNIYELNARLSEFATIGNIFKQINNIEDVNSKNKALVTLREQVLLKHTEWLENIGFNNNQTKEYNTSHIEDYFDMCEIIIKENFKNNPEKLFEDYKQTTLSQLSQLSNELKKLEMEIQNATEQIENSFLAIQLQYPQTTIDSIVMLYDTNMYTIAKPDSLSKLKEALKEINNSFSLPLLKSIQPPSAKKQNIYLHIAQKLEELQRAINETPEYQLSTNDKMELQKLSKQLATNIINSEQEILLIASGAYEKIRNIAEMQINEKTQENQDVKQGRLLEIYNQMKKENVAKQSQQSSQINQPRFAPKQKDDDLEL